MKRTVFVLAVMLGALTVGAQDTVEIEGMPEGYLYGSNWSNIKNHLGFHPFSGPATGGEYAKRFLLDDTVTIYGIAASVVDVTSTYPQHAYDQTYANSIEYLRLYRNQDDTLCPIAQAPLHMHTTPISYYCQLDCPDHYQQSRKIAPMYELYFENPVTVCDSFYTGMTFFIERPYVDSTGVRYGYAAIPLALNYIGIMTNMGDDCEHCIIRHLHREDDGSEYSVWGYCRDGQMIYMLFPILTPQYDSTSLGADLTPEQMLQRYTAVSPNPAVGTAKVVSSVGLLRIEAFDAAGQRIFDQQAQGLSANIDIAPWPAGTYILRIHTPQGIVTKKLTVTR